ncbi:MAG: phage tail protein [Roseovarius sp.]|nr:phage tail protein [Roseovarius sp.]
MSMKIDTSDMKKAHGFLRGIRGAMEKASFRAVNRIASKTRTAASKGIRSQVRLPASYVNENLKVTKKANSKNPTATISARVRPTRLARYGAKQMTKAAPRARGDSRRGIGAGRKQGGVSVHVSRQRSRAKMGKAFLIPLKNTDMFGVFVRMGPGQKNIKHLYGPSVDQLFRSWRDGERGDVQDQLATEYRAQLRYALQQAVKR